MYTILLGLAATAAFASPVALDERALFTAPTATIKNGTVIGSSNALAQVDSFNGIPFAQPPVGNLRLRNPTPVQSSFGTFTATGTPTACPGFIKSMPTPTGLALAAQTILNELPLFQVLAPTGEDCLTINVQKPSSAKAGDKLPVLVYIYGGGFEVGSASMYDGTSVIQHAVSLGKPIVYAAMNYRVGAFGFLAGKELAGNANLGLKDQRLALQWIQENIAAFGGDPSRVTIWGESAGAISVFDHTVINGGDNTYNGKPLFIGGIMNSGSVVPTLPIDSVPAQTVYNTVVKNANCSGASDTLQCLRQAPYQTFLNAAQSVPGIFDYQSLDLSYLPRQDPSTSFFSKSADQYVADGQYAKVPVIIGDQEDEGTLFSFVQSNVTDTDKLVTYLNSYFPTVARSDVQKLVNVYPDDPAFGSPFRTGQLNNVYPQFKRLAAILGDITFTLTRRAYLQNVTTNGVEAWSYLNTYLYGLTGPLGTLHGSDVINNRIVPLSLTAQPATLTFYTSFTYYQNPNQINNTITWPKWTSSGRELLNFTAINILNGKDDFREDQYKVLLSLDHILKV